MKKSVFRACASATALAVAAALVQPAMAQDAAAKDDAGLDEIVVTASARDKTQLNSAISVTSVSADVIQNFKPSSEAEVFRLIPGIQVPGTSGPGGNSNIAVRGLPVATGGSPFVQIQEDGLPVVLFGDMNFGNNDYWTRFDASVANVEGVRGGTAATLASQAPGAIINYISQTGKQEGGYVQVNKALNFNETKVDFRYGGSLTDNTYFHVGGFFKRGSGPLHAGYNVSDSYQIKANVTREFDDNKGFIRLYVKVADTQEPNYTGAPALATINGKKISNFQPFDGFDGRNQSNYSKYNQDMLILNRAGGLERVALDGITTKQKSFGAQLKYDFSDKVTLDNNLRWSSISGGFASPFLNLATTASIIGSTISRPGLADEKVASIRYANGPNAGQVYTGKYVDNNTNVRTNIRDLGSFVNDLALSTKFDMAGGTLTARAGFFYMDQHIAQDWHTNKSTREVGGNNPAQLDLYNAAGAKLTQQGISGYNNNWGDCCARDYDLRYTDQAPYLALDLDTDQFVLDGSVRREYLKATGWAQGGGSPFLVNSNGVQIAAITSNGTRETLDYTRSYTNWTVGALYKADENTSLFARTSRGGRFNSDRQILSGKFAADGSLNQQGITPSVDYVNQHEIGVKNRGELLGGRYTAELSLLKANFKQSTYELSATRCNGSGGCIIDANFKSTGAEFYGTYRIGGFTLFGTATYTKAKRKLSGATAYTRAPNLPNLGYTISANYDVNELASVGISTTGQTSTVDDAQNIYSGGAIFNGNIVFRPLGNLELGIQAYNLFNRLDFRGNGNTLVSSSGTSAVISGTPVIGRTFTGSVRVRF
jgi:outer membrane receptor protein involved in Fe transport